MKLTIARDTLLSAVRQCHLRSIGIGNPALGLVALTATKILKQGAPDALALRASIGLVAIDTLVVAVVEEEGEVAVDCRALKDTIAGMPASGDIKLELRKDKLSVTHGKRRWTGQTQPAERVQPLPLATAEARTLLLPARELLTMIDRVRFAVDDVPGDKPHRAGIYLDVRDQVPTAIAWGEHLNALYTPEPPPAVSVNQNHWALLLTPHVIDRLRELTLEDGSPDVELRYEVMASGTPGFAWLKNSSTLICFMPPIEPFLDWRTMLTRVKYSPVCRLPRLALMQSLSALIASADEQAQARVTVDAKAHEILLEHYAGPRKGGAEGSTVHFEDSITVTGVEVHDKVIFHLNARYFREAIDAAGEDVVLHLESGGTAVVLTTERGYTCFVSLVFPE